MGLILLRTIWLISLLCITFLLILSSCHNDTTIGMNEISLNKLEDKIEEDQSFFLVTILADEKDVQESDLVEALEEVFANNDQKTFFISSNKDDHYEETLYKKEKEHKSTNDKEKPLQSKKNRIVLIQHEEVIKQSPTMLHESSNMQIIANKNHGEKNKYYE